MSYSDIDPHSQKIINSAAGLMASMYKRKKIPSLSQFVRNIPSEPLAKKEESITGTYCDDCNIIYMDKQIKNILSSPVNSIDYVKRITEIEDELSKPHTLIKDKVLHFELGEIKKKMRDSECNAKLNEYISETKDLLEEYIRIRKDLVITIDVSDVVTGSIDESDEIYAKRMKIISEFLRIASKYVLVNVHRKSSKSDKCPVCDVDFTETEDFYLCPECGIQITKVKEVVIEHDQKIYESKVNLLKAFNKLQGKDSLIPNDMYKTLDEYCLENNIPISSEVRSMELNPDGTRGNVNIDLLQLILRKTGYKNQYENIPLIAHEYWGWTLYDDLDEYKEEIFNEYDKLEGVLESLKDKDESSSPNVQYKLYRLVSRCYPKCSKSHFRLPKDIGKLESKTYRAYKILGWKFDALAI